MDSINRCKGYDRLAYIADTATASQGLTKSIKAHMKEIEKAVGVKRQANIGEFMANHGRGI